MAIKKISNCETWGEMNKSLQKYREKYPQAKDLCNDVEFVLRKWQQLDQYLATLSAAAKERKEEVEAQEMKKGTITFPDSNRGKDSGV